MYRHLPVPAGWRGAGLQGGALRLLSLLHAGPRLQASHLYPDQSMAISLADPDPFFYPLVAIR